MSNPLDLNKYIYMNYLYIARETAYVAELHDDPKRSLLLLEGGQVFHNVFVLQVFQNFDFIF